MILLGIPIQPDGDGKRALLPDLGPSSDIAEKSSSAIPSRWNIARRRGIAKEETPGLQTE